jgi:hypothetical protein
VVANEDTNYSEYQMILSDNEIVRSLFEKDDTLKERKMKRTILLKVKMGRLILKLLMHWIWRLNGLRGKKNRTSLNCCN